MDKLAESPFEVWWKQKIIEIKQSNVKPTLSITKTLCYLAWMKGAKLEFQKEVGALQRATTAMNRRAKARGKKK